MRVLIVDDDKLVALSLKTILEADSQIEVAGIGSSGAEAIALFETLRPDILLMDIRMEGMTGLEAGSRILEKEPATKILFLTTFSDDEYIVKALRMGAKGYILKQNFESIAPALIAVHNGQTVFGDEITNKLPNLMNPSSGMPDFGSYDITEKEMEIIRQVAEGLNNKEIAEKLFLSEGTVRNYLSVILDKLGLRDRTQLAVFYYRR
ncbi:MAG: response regulator transcription factor [Lachnospiraceae bacterium]|nr:response regulator transcription factor [Lachnospiraceae bacterium]